MKRNWTGWRRLLGLPTRGRTITRRQSRTHLRLEPLEDRTVPATVSIDGTGMLYYVAGAGVNNNLAISFDGNHTYTLTDSAETITTSGENALLMCRGSGTNTLTVNANSVFLPPYHHTPALSGMNVDLGDGSNTLSLQSNAVPINIDNTQGGSDVVTLGNGTMAGIQNNVSVENPSGSTSLTLADSSDSLSGEVVVMKDGQLSGLEGAGIISWTPSSSPTGGVTSLAVFGGSGTNSYLVENTSNLFAGTFLSTGTGGNVPDSDGVQVWATSGPLDIYNPGGVANIFVGNDSNSMANINGYVDVYGPGSTELGLYDGGDTTNQTVSMYDGSVYGLAPAPIYWTPTSSAAGGVTLLFVQGSSGTDVFNVYNTSNLYYWTNLQTGGGGGSGSTSSVNVYATTGTLDIANYAGQDTTNIGLGSLANINGSVYVAPGGTETTSLIVDDHLDSTARTATLTGTTLTGLGNAGTIYYNEDVLYGYTGGVTSLTIDGGSGNNTYNVLSSTDAV